MRLVGGAIAQEGRVEVCYDGVWGNICPSGWDYLDALVACKQLGYTHSGICHVHVLMHAYRTRWLKLNWYIICAACTMYAPKAYSA